MGSVTVTLTLTDEEYGVLVNAAVGKRHYNIRQSCLTTGEVSQDYLWQAELLQTVVRKLVRVTGEARRQQAVGMVIEPLERR